MGVAVLLAGCGAVQPAAHPATTSTTPTVQAASDQAPAQHCPPGTQPIGNGICTAPTTTASPTTSTPGSGPIATGPPPPVTSTTPNSRQENTAKSTEPGYAPPPADMLPCGPGTYPMHTTRCETDGGGAPICASGMSVDNGDGMTTCLKPSTPTNGPLAGEGSNAANVPPASTTTAALDCTPDNHCCPAPLTPTLASVGPGAPDTWSCRP